MKTFGENRHRVFLGDTNRYRYASTTDGAKMQISSMKAFMISPYTNPDTISFVTDYILSTKEIMDQELST